MLPYNCIQVLVAHTILLYAIYLTALILLNVILMNEYQHRYVKDDYLPAIGIGIGIGIANANAIAIVIATVIGLHSHTLHTVHRLKLEVRSSA